MLEFVKIILAKKIWTMGTIWSILVQIFLAIKWHQIWFFYLQTCHFYLLATQHKTTPVSPFPPDATQGNHQNKEELVSLHGDARFAREEKEQGESEHAAMQAESRSLNDSSRRGRRSRGWRRRGRRPRDA